MILCEYLKDNAGYTAGKYQLHDERTAEGLIKAGICRDANNGDHAEGEPTKHDLFLERVNAFRAELVQLYSYPTIKELEPRVQRLQAEYKHLAAIDDWPQRGYDLRSINQQADRLQRLIIQAEDRETVLARWEVGGSLYEQKVKALNADIQQAQSQIYSPDAQEKQIGAARLKGDQQKLNEIEMLRDNLKEQIRVIRG